MRLGAHLSITGGISQAVIAAHKIGANTLQIFSTSPRSWQKPNLLAAEIEKFKKLTKKYHISPIFIHAKYLVNLASDNSQTIQKSITSLVNDLKIASQIDAQGVIFHPRTERRRLLISSLKKVLSQTPTTTFLILENSAQMKLTTLGKIIKKTRSRRLKFCLDLAHAYQAGYNITFPQGRKKLFKIIEKEVGLDRLIVIHTNDSQTGYGSKYDRHEDIGRGRLGRATFTAFLHHPISSKLPFILETPGFREKGLAADKKNLAVLKKLAASSINQTL